MLQPRLVELVKTEETEAVNNIAVGAELPCMYEVMYVCSHGSLFSS